MIDIVNIEHSIVKDNFAHSNIYSQVNLFTIIKSALVHVSLY